MNNLVGFGYNVFKGNPSSMTGADPGFQSQIFDKTYNQNLSTSSGFKIPDYYELIEFKPNNYVLYQKEYLNMHQYLNELKNQAKIEKNIDFFLQLVLLRTMN